jgi:hypothetical protein
VSIINCPELSVNAMGLQLPLPLACISSYAYFINLVTQKPESARTITLLEKELFPVLVRGLFNLIYRKKKKEKGLTGSIWNENVDYYQNRTSQGTFTKLSIVTRLKTSSILCKLCHSTLTSLQFKVAVRNVRYISFCYALLW